MNDKLTRQVEEMKKQTIGVEIEMNNITREKAASLAAEFFGTGRHQYTARRNGYETWSAWDADGREWKFQKDVSIVGPDSQKCELVTPILTYADIELLQELVRRLRKAGAKSDATEEVCREYERMEDKEHKREQRANECQHKKDGSCLSTLCKGCLNYIPSKDGSGTLSLNQIIEVNGDVFEDTFHESDPEKELDKKEFWKTFERVIDSLTQEEKAFAEAIINGTPDKELMRKLGITKQSTCNSRKKTVRMKMQVAMADYKNN